MNSRVNGLNVDLAQLRGSAAPLARRRHDGKWAVLGVALAAALALPLGASARGHGNDYRGGHSGNYYGQNNGNYGHGNYNRGYYNSGNYNRGYYNGGYGNRGYNRGHSNGGQWIAGALVAGAVISMISNSRPADYERPVVYSQPRVVYDSYYPAPVVRRRVVQTRTVYEDPYQTRYVRSDGDDYDD